MKIGFSSLVCPTWDLATIILRAQEYGFDGVELRGLRGELRLTQVPELAGNPGATRQQFEAANVELVCLGTSCTLASRDRKTLARERAELEENIELASRLGCPHVRMFMGEVQKGEVREKTLSRIGTELSRAASVAAERRVTLLIENGGDFCGSADLWYVCDVVSHPAVRVCWNPCVAMTRLERPTTSVPRLGHKIGMVHVCDAEFDDQGFMLDGYKLPGAGHVGLARAIELLKGIAYQGYLVFEWPKLWDPSLAAAEKVLPDVAAFLRSRLAEKQPILTAYKGDKNAPAFKAALPKAGAP